MVDKSWNGNRPKSSHFFLLSNGLFDGCEIGGLAADQLAEFLTFRRLTAGLVLDWIFYGWAEVRLEQGPPKVCIMNISILG
jgi:hypothetical protein